MTHHFALVLVADGDVGVLHGDVLLDELALGLLGLGLSLGDGARDDGAAGDDLLGLGGAEAGLLGAGSGCAVSEAVRRSRRSRGAASVDGVVGTRLGVAERWKAHSPAATSRRKRVRTGAVGGLTCATGATEAMADIVADISM